MQEKISAKELLTSSEKFHINLGLKRVLEALEKLGNPHKKMKYIHVAGTNGKGSVCAMLNQILCEHFKNSGVKIGLYTSPHLFSYCERIKINGVEISQSDLDFYVDKVAKINPELTEFEILTVSAFLYFCENNVDYVILEVGLGGRFDATNVVDSPLVSIITTLDYDHTAILGNDIEKIAFEKAGIIKENSRVVIGKSNLGLKVIKKQAKKIGAEFLISDENVEICYENSKNYAVFEYFGEKIKAEFALLGDYQAKNLSLVLCAVQNLPFKISKEVLIFALKNSKWRFRLEYNKDKKLLIDGAHNPSGIATLREFLNKNFSGEKITFIFGCLDNKDYSNMLKTLVNKDKDEFYFYEFDYKNALKFENLPKEIKSFALQTKNPLEIINNHQDLCVVCGSLYMLGELFS